MRLILIVIFLINTLISFAQKTEATHLLKYTQKDGLPSYNVRKVIQDSKGFIWAGTQDGVSRFDGKSFLNYSKSSSRKNKICGVDVRELIEDTVRDLLWILPGEVGINAISTITGEVVLTAPILGTSSEDWNISMLKDKDILWIGTSTGVKAFNTSKKIYETGLVLPMEPATSTYFETRSIIKDEHANIWACYSGYGIVIYDGQTKKIIKEIRLSELNDHSKSNDIRFYSYVAPKPGEILFATSQGLRKVSYSSSYQFKIDNTPCKAISAFNTVSIDYIAINKQNEILIAGNSKLCRFDLLLGKNTTLEEPAKTSETDWLSAVQCIYNDRENNLWLGCQEGLAFISKYPSPFKSYNYDKLTNTKLEHVRSIYALDNGDILAGLRNGIVEIRNFDAKYIKYDTGHLYHHIFQDNKGLIHVSRPDGMFIYMKGKLLSISKAYAEFTPYASYPVNSHLLVNDTMVILGTESSNGILLWNPVKRIVKKIEQTNNKSLLSSSIVNNIYKDSRGNIWVLSDNVISVLSPDLTKGKEVIPVEIENGLPYKLFFDMCEGNGYYWIASYGSGVLQLDSAFNLKGVLNAEKGLSNDGTYQIYNIGNKNILVTSNSGISLIDINAFKIKNYFAKNGLHSNGFEEVSGLMKNGKIYAGGVNGFTVIDPRYFSTNSIAPILYINNIQIKAKSGLIDTSNFLSTSINVPNNVLQTTIYFSALNYSNPERTTFAYKIEEQHSDWINIGNNNLLPLIGVPPGTYHLKVRAFNEDGVSSEIKELILIFLPKWYQTWWFKALVALTIVAIGYALYRLRVNQFKKEQQIRSKLASDLHDDLGSTMNSVKVYANLAIMEKQKEKYLFKIKESTQEAITGIRDIIWVLDDSKDTIEHLLSRISLFASPLCEANNILYKQEMTDEARNHKLGQEEKRNLYMMLKETVNNAVKYSGAKKIEIEVSVKKGKPAIQIKDDGNGFDAKAVSDGNGLKNMKRRAHQIKYKFSLESVPGHGTHIQVQKI